MTNPESIYDVLEDMTPRKSLLLYRLQAQAPRASVVTCPDPEACRPQQFGEEHHGIVSREEASRRLGGVDGHYLVRSSSSQPGTDILSFILSGQVRHFVMHSMNGEFHIGENHFETVDDMVTDGLITLFMEENHAEEYIDQGTKLARRPAVYTRRRGAHIMKYQMGIESPVKDNTGLGRAKAVKMKASKFSMKRQQQWADQGKENVLEDSLDHNPEEHVVHDVEPDEDIYSVIDECMEVIGTETVVGATEPNLEDDPPPLPPRAYSKVSPRNKRKSSALEFIYEKKHQFKVLTFAGPTWCDICSHFLWGLKKQGQKCQDCGIAVHTQCAKYAEADCLPSRERVSRVYSVDLTAWLRLEGTKIPQVVRECVHAVENIGLEVEGIYRVSGAKDDIYTIKADFDSGLPLDMTEVVDIHAVTGALKLYLRELPIPLISFEVFEQLLGALDTDAGMKQEQVISACSSCLPLLPLSHANVLKYVMRHLKRVVQHRETNKMTTRNLAVVFAPTIMRTESNDAASFTLIPKQQILTEFLIDHIDLVL